MTSAAAIRPPRLCVKGRRSRAIALGLRVLITGQAAGFCRRLDRTVLVMECRRVIRSMYYASFKSLKRGGKNSSVGKATLSKSSQGSSAAELIALSFPGTQKS